MSSAYHLRMMSHRAADTELLFLHQSRATEEAFAEAAYRWPDQRGRYFTTHHLGPIAELFPSVSSALVKLTRSMQTAALHAQLAEDHLTIARVRGQEVMAAESAALRLSDAAQQTAGFALTRSQAALTRANSISGDLSVLGNPPI